ncbi:hypothetical protein PISMIDRAFT_246557 [Pisolithus microcarpus 441]|uniref:Uncharacterized protein n=1 Tax=Pisolithus microcarpus 441 TaxID=765257 RepID=A0A0C9ZX05_9AGAM|nr:hypothetical protein PISMIDRAFT_246557 [Pisolithus microcarpus 441]
MPVFRSNECLYSKSKLRVSGEHGGYQSDSHPTQTTTWGAHLSRRASETAAEAPSSALRSLAHLEVRHDRVS